MSIQTFNLFMPLDPKTLENKDLVAYLANQFKKFTLNQLKNVPIYPVQESDLKADEIKFVLEDAVDQEKPMFWIKYGLDTDRVFDKYYVMSVANRIANQFKEKYGCIDVPIES